MKDRIKKIQEWLVRKIRKYWSNFSHKITLNLIKRILYKNFISKLVLVLIAIYLLDIFLIFSHANLHKNSLFSIISLKYLSLYVPDYLIIGVLKNLGTTLKTFLYFFTSILFIRILLSFQYFLLKDISEEEKKSLEEQAQKKESNILEKDSNKEEEKNNATQIGQYLNIFQNSRIGWQVLTLGSLALSLGFSIHFTIHDLPQFNRVKYETSLSQSEIKFSQSLQVMIEKELQKLDSYPPIPDSNDKEKLQYTRNLRAIAELISIRNQIESPIAKECLLPYPQQICIASENENNGADLEKLLKQFNTTMGKQISILDDQRKNAADY